MEVLNRNQRAAALWRLSGLYAATIVIMGIIVYQSWKSYRSRADAAMEAKVIALFKDATNSIVKDAKPAPEKPANNSGNNVQGNLNEVNGKLMQAKAVQTTAKSIESLTKDLNPMKK